MSAARPAHPITGTILSEEYQLYNSLLHAIFSISLLLPLSQIHSPKTQKKKTEARFSKTSVAVFSKLHFYIVMSLSKLLVFSPQHARRISEHFSSRPEQDWDRYRGWGKQRVLRFP
jgi:hypothetical protein